VFTGLVQDVGALVSRTSRGPGARLGFRTKLRGLEPGESISVDGACLTVDRTQNDVFEVDASGETLKKTTLGQLAVGSRVNLERALKMGDRLGGHIVTGHVDGVGALVSRAPLGDAVAMSFSLARDLARFVAQKGSITVSGVSLTVNEIEGDRFDVVIIPRTLAETTLGTLQSGSQVNLEVDLLARYVARLMGSSADESIMVTLHKAGFV
jgi:riboflavin synthase